MGKLVWLVALMLLFSVAALAAYSGGSRSTPPAKPKPLPVAEEPQPTPPTARPEPAPEPAAVEPMAPASKPALDESKAKCLGPSSVVERVKCRLRLTDEELAETEPDGSTEIYFLPEECRPLGGEARGQCVSAYARVQACWRFEGETREECLRKRVGLPEKSSVRDEKIKCLGDACREELRQRVYSLVKFRLYSLEDKASKLLRKGVSEDTVAQFISEMEQKKAEFNAATSLEARKKVLQGAARLWNDFKLEAYKQVRTGT